MKTQKKKRRWLTPKELWERVLAMSVGDCLPWIAACMLLCSIATGYTVLWLEQKEQHRMDTFEVYRQEYKKWVIDAAAEELAQEQQAAEEAAAAAAAENDQVPEDTQALEQGTADTTQEAADPPVQEQRVYASPSGKRYHYDAACPGKNGQEITWDEVERRGLTPCQKCAA